MKKIRMSPKTRDETSQIQNLKPMSGDRDPIPTVLPDTRRSQFTEKSPVPQIQIGRRERRRHIV
jgi:hypothetical protein